MFNDPSIDSLLVHYEEMSSNLDKLSENIRRFVPQLGELGKRRSAISAISATDRVLTGPERGEDIVKYFQHSPLEWIPKSLNKDTLKLLCDLEYDDHGECAGAVRP